MEPMELTREQQIELYAADEPVTKFNGWAVIVEVSGGVAYISAYPKNCTPIIVDYDNFPDAEIDWLKDTITWGDPAK